MTSLETDGVSVLMGSRGGGRSISPESASASSFSGFSPSPSSLASVSSDLANSMSTSFCISLINFLIIGNYSEEGSKNVCAVSFLVN